MDDVRVHHLRRVLRSILQYDEKMVIYSSGGTAAKSAFEILARRPFDFAS